MRPDLKLELMAYRECMEARSSTVSEKEKRSLWSKEVNRKEFQMVTERTRAIFSFSLPDLRTQELGFNFFLSTKPKPNTNKETQAQHEVLKLK